jgi:D-sedoheptulose 7-phosphate isomerase
MTTEAQTTLDHLVQRLEGSLRSIEAIRPQLPEVLRLGQSILERMDAGGILYTAGNGGSAAQSLHMAEELVGRYRGNRPPLPAISLNADPTALTCIANDFGFESIFSRPCQALLRPGDILLVFTTSGRSDNIIEALQVARTTGALTIGFLGGDGGPCRDLCDHPVIIEGPDSAFIQDAHQVLIHLVCELAELRSAQH